MALAKDIKALFMAMSFACNAKLFLSTALSTGYFVDVSLAI